MSEAIIVAVITGGLALTGSIVSFIGSIKVSTKQHDKRQAIIEYKIEELTREVREHNNFARRMPVVENEIANLKEKINIK